MTAAETEQDVSAEEYFRAERRLFVEIAERATKISHAIGRREVDMRRGIASWLFMRLCLSAKSLARLLVPEPTGYGDASYLDHASIASLARAPIENVAVLLYLGDKEASENAWWCRKHLVDLHDFSTYLPQLIIFSVFGRAMIERTDSREVGPVILAKSLSDRRHGRRNALSQIGWELDHTKAIYKYLSMQTHTMPMSFHRSEARKIYAQGSSYPKAVAGFAIQHARQAIQVACARMLDLFPDISVGGF